MQLAVALRLPVLVSTAVLSVFQQAWAAPPAREVRALSQQSKESHRRSQSARKYASHYSPEKQAPKLDAPALCSIPAKSAVAGRRGNSDQQDRQTFLLFAPPKTHTLTHHRPTMCLSFWTQHTAHAVRLWCPSSFLRPLSGLPRRCSANETVSSCGLRLLLCKA